MFSLHDKSMLNHKLFSESSLMGISEQDGALEQSLIDTLKEENKQIIK